MYIAFLQLFLRAFLTTCINTCLNRIKHTYGNHHTIEDNPGDTVSHGSCVRSDIAFRSDQLTPLGIACPHLLSKFT